MFPAECRVTQPLRERGPVPDHRTWWTVVTTHATYTPVSDRAVIVSGAEFEPASEYTVKLEAARLAGFSTSRLGRYS